MAVMQLLWIKYLVMNGCDAIAIAIAVDKIGSNGCDAIAIGWLAFAIAVIAVFAMAVMQMMHGFPLSQWL